MQILILWNNVGILIGVDCSLPFEKYVVVLPNIIWHKHKDRNM